MAVDAGTILSEVRVALDTLTGDVRAVNTQLDKIVKKSDETSGKSQKGFSKFFSFLKSTGVGSFLAVGSAVAILTKQIGDSISKAESAQEIYSKFDTVFETISGQAENVAATFADSFDLAESTAKELLGTTGDLITGFGASEDVALSLSERVNILAGDLASFSNIEGGVSQASRALTAALLGEREQAKQLGIVIREADVQTRLLEKGQANLTGQALLLAKAEATLEIATTQSAKALGDYSRTSGSAANAGRRLEESTKELKEAIGTGLLPTVTAIRNKLGEWASAIAEVIKNSNELRDANKAVDEGNATLEQRLILIKREGEEQRKVLAALTAYIDQGYKNTEAEKRQIEEIQNRLILLGEQEIAIKQQIYAEEQLIKKQNEEAAATAAAAQAAADRAEQARSDYEFRLGVQAELEAQLFTIAQQEQLAAQNGEEFNAAIERQSAAQAALVKLFDEGFRLSGPGVQEFIDLYGELLDVTEDNTSAQAELAEAARLASEERTAAAQESLADQLKASMQFTQDNLDLLYEQNRLTLESYVELSDALAEQTAAKAEQLLQDAQSFVNTAGGIFSSFFSAIDAIATNSNDAELQRLQARIDAEEEGTAKRIALEEEYNERAKELENEQASRKKALRTFDALINTAAAIIGFLAEPGGEAGVALSIGAGIVGAAQVAAIQSEPLPNFATGGIVLPSAGGTAVNVAENGSPELLLNGGAQGSALLDEFANRIASAISARGASAPPMVLYLDGDQIAVSAAKRYNNGKVKLKR